PAARTGCRSTASGSSPSTRTPAARPAPPNGNGKIWAVPLYEMETSRLAGRVPMPDLEEAIEGALTQKPKPMGPNARFSYPLRGGFQALMNGFLPHLKGELRLNSRVKSVSVLRRVVTLHDGTELPYEQLVSTMP